MVRAHTVAIPRSPIHTRLDASTYLSFVPRIIISKTGGEGALVALLNLPMGHGVWFSEGSMLNLPEGTVKSRLHRARSILAEEP